MEGNPHKGEVTLSVDGVTYTLRYSIDSICRLEETTGKGLPLIAAQMANPLTATVTLARQLLMAGLLDGQPDMTLDQAGRILVGGGGVNPVMEKIGRALQLAFPSPAGDGASSGSPRKGPRQNGTGRPS